MLDENLPTFFIKPSYTDHERSEALYLSQYGSEPQPAYSFRHADSSSEAGKNVYAAALFDSYNPDVLFGQAVAGPLWTPPSPSQDDIRRTGGLPYPPQPTLPTQFTIQLFNPQQHVNVVQKPGTWGGSSSYGFAMPQSSFRTPSSSALDRIQMDPAVAATTPHLNFVWRKESKLSKDLTCYFTGKSNVQGIKKKNKEPDIPVALFRSWREITIYESNLYRLEMEDAKGFELVLLLGAIVIRDIYFGHIKSVFNTIDPQRKASTEVPSAKHLSPMGSPDPAEVPTNEPSISCILTQRPLRASRPSAPPSSQVRSHGAPSGSAPHDQQQWVTHSHESRPPPGDPRTQLEIDAETARLKAEVEAEERQRHRLDQTRRKEQQKAEEAKIKRLRRMVEAEESVRRRREAEIDKETERLRRLYGQQESPMQQPPYRRPPIVTSYSPRPQTKPHTQTSPYLQAPTRPYGAATTAFVGSSTELGADKAHKLRSGKRSMWGLRMHSERSTGKLTRKASSMF